MQIPANTPDDFRQAVIYHLETLRLAYTHKQREPNTSGRVQMAWAVRAELIRGIQDLLAKATIIPIHPPKETTNDGI